jgi:hypothetical protein
VILKYGVHSIHSDYDTGDFAGFCENGDELLGYIASREFIDELSVYWLLKKDSAF